MLIFQLLGNIWRLIANLRDDVTEPHPIRETNKGGAVCDPASLLQKTEKGRSTRSRGYAKPDSGLAVASTLGIPSDKAIGKGIPAKAYITP